MSAPVGLVGWGTYFPPQIETAADLVDRTGIPEAVLVEKLGIRQRHIAGADDTVVTMATKAAQRALEQAGIPGEKVNLVISHGSEFKDHVMWNAAGKIQHNIGAIHGYGFEVYALCASGVIALNTAKSLMQGDERLEYVLLAAASRENDLINLKNPRARFMYNFGSGGGAMLLRRGATTNQILGTAYMTDGSLSETILFKQTEDAIGEGEGMLPNGYYGRLDVDQYEWMSDRLAEITLANFTGTIREAVARSGASMADVKFLGISQMKRSFWLQILEAIGLTPEQSVYMEDHGHVQSVDQVMALEMGLQQGKVKPGDLIVLSGAGGGYTWGAVAVQWG
ncbi:MAG: 3-oxoacyl-ACP synthase [Anaerolineae bacterium]|nr:3-oxoacyl-ACP synthase [Anaerolineae bacterium]